MTHLDFLAQSLAAFFDTAPKTRLIRFIRGVGGEIGSEEKLFDGQFGEYGEEWMDWGPTSVLLPPSRN